VEWTWPADPRGAIEGVDALLSPSLVIDRGLVRRNLEAMIALAGGADRLRPHVKTHKMAAVVRLAGSLGIRKHKCATLAEAEMVAAAGGDDVLIAYPLVGPNPGRLAELADAYPATTFRALVEDPEGARGLSKVFSARSRRPLSILIDLDVGMSRTGLPVSAAAGLCERVGDLPGLVFGGLHAYDGQIRESDPEQRRLAAAGGMEAVLGLRDRLIAGGLPVERIVLGGTPTFPVHAALTVPGVECSPGTCVLHDAGYASRFPDLPFLPAAALLTRVVSRPRPGRLCLDLGHKAVAADPPGARLTLLGIPEGRLGSQSEEHLIVETPHAADFPTGTPLFAIPTHICPTCALHRAAYVIEGGQLVETWEVTARDRALSIENPGET